MIRRLVVLVVTVAAGAAFSGRVAAVPKPEDNPKPAEVVEVEIAKGVKMKFCWIPAGEAHLGSPKSEQDYVANFFGKRLGWFDEESESFRGEFATKGFWLGKYTVTQKQWVAMMGKDPSWFSNQGGGKEKVAGKDTSNYPVESVSWDDCQGFLQRLKRDAKRPVELRNAAFSLPHEDQWEYACRGGRGNLRPFYFGEELNGTQANCNGNHPYGSLTTGTYLERTTEVGSYERVSPHPWGLCDMSGNVYQWCENTFDNRNSRRVLRGGSWKACSWGCRSADRYLAAPAGHGIDIGFRVAVLP
jgi:formylglycine-generating enzyme required for sulfatase activity